jgi:TP901 family phage tail tape measure protein
MLSNSLMSHVVKLRPELDRREFERAGQQGADAAARKVTDGMGKAGKDGGKAVGDGVKDGLVKGAEEGAREAMQKLNSQFGKMKSVGNKMTLGVTAPLLAIGTAATKSAMGFEESMAKITALVGIPREQVQAWEADVRNLGKTYGASGGEAAEALFFITSAGLRGSDAMGALEASLKASAVGLGDVATIADLATSAMNAYGPATLSAEAATDVLTATVREGKLEADQLAGAMGSTLPIASAMGVQLKEVGAAFAAMSRTGTGANEAATQLNAILMTLQKPSKQAQDMLEEMGLSASGLRRQIRERGLLSALQTLTTAFGDNEEAAAMVFNNSRALRGVLDMLGSGAEQTAEIFGNMADTTGTVDTAFGVMADTSAFKTRQAIAELKDEAMTFGQALLPVAQELSKAIGAIAGAFEKLSPGQRQALIYFGLIAAAAGPMLRLVGTIGQITTAHRLAAIAAGQHAAATRGIGMGGIGGKGGAAMLGKVGLAAGGAYLAYDGLTADNFGTTDALKTVGGAALTGAMIGSVVPGVGTAVGGAVGGAVGFGAALWRGAQMAEGGHTMSAGYALVGENGPEMVRLPRSASVIPLDHNGGSGITISGPIYITANDTATFERELDRVARRSAATSSYRRPL